MCQFFGNLVNFACFPENTAIIPHNDITSKPLVSFNTETGFVKYTRFLDVGKSLHMQNKCNVVFLIRLEITSPCPMSFHYYPLDTQRCEINIRSCKCLAHKLATL